MQWKKKMFGFGANSCIKPIPSKPKPLPPPDGYLVIIGTCPGPYKGQCGDPERN